MATITKVQSASNRLGATPWGNLSALHYTLATNAAGAALGGDIDSHVAPDDWITALAALPLIDQPGVDGQTVSTPSHNRIRCALAQA